MTLTIRGWSKLGWLWLATLPPAILVATLVARNAVDTLFMDDWSMVGNTLIRAGSADLGIKDLIAQHNESRPLFPKLLFLGVGLLAEGETRWCLLVSPMLACLVSYSVLFLARATVAAKPWHLWSLTFLANLLIFTPKQGEAWLWSSYLGLEPIACLAVSLAVLHSSLSPTKRLAISAALCTIATFSYANGLSTWLLVAPVVALAFGPWRLGWWTIGLALNASVFFHGYVKPPQHPPLLEGLRPLRLSQYVLAFLGAPLGLNEVALASAVGAFFVVLLVLVAAYLLIHAHDAELRRRLMPWLSIGGYALVSALAAGVGRSPFGIGQALVNRYISFSLYLGLALLFLISIVLSHARANGLLSPTALRVVHGFVAVCLAGCLVLQANAGVLGAHEIVQEGRMLRYGKTCLLFINVQPDETCLSRWVYPSTRILRAYASSLDRMGYLHPGLVKSRRLQDLRPEGPAAQDDGVFEKFSIRPGRARLVAAGWAGLPTAARPADAVILARQATNGDWMPIAFAPVFEPRPELAGPLGGSYRNAGWRTGLVKRDLPPGLWRISAWAFDATRGWALPLRGIHTAEGGGRKNRGRERGEMALRHTSAVVTGSSEPQTDDGP
jgi:hypothetical protein